VSGVQLASGEEKLIMCEAAVRGEGRRVKAPFSKEKDLPVRKGGAKIMV